MHGTRDVVRQHCIESAMRDVSRSGTRRMLRLRVRQDISMAVLASWHYRESASGRATALAGWLPNGSYPRAISYSKGDT